MGGGDGCEFGLWQGARSLWARHTQGSESRGTTFCPLWSPFVLEVDAAVHLPMGAVTRAHRQQHVMSLVLRRPSFRPFAWGY